MVGYKGADAIADEFVRAAVTAFSKWGVVTAWPHPVSCASGTWAALAAHGASRPRIAWYFARVGGDEFGFAWVSDEPALSQIRTKVLEKAAKDAEAKLPSVIRGEGPNQWRLRCIGANVEAEASSYADRSKNERRKQEHAEQLWTFVTRASQTVKREHKGQWDARWPTDRVGFLNLEDLLSGFRERYAVGPVPREASYMALSGAWEVPFPELRDYLPIVPHDDRLRVLTSTRGGAALLCRYEDASIADTEDFVPPGIRRTSGSSVRSPNGDVLPATDALP